MGHHRVQRGGRRVAAPRPRYRRIGAATGSVVITAVAVLGGIGVLPSGSGSGPVYAADVSSGVRDGVGTAQLSGAAVSSLAVDPREPRTDGPASVALPEHSGKGRRIVFDMSQQRVWLVDREAHHDAVLRTYLVSGSLTDNLQPGSYEVYSKSLHAWGIADSGTMMYMVRFAHGPNAAIGFHDIPVDDGHRVQTRAELGTPRSHGCIRQWRPDAKALWAFAPVGTKVVVTA